MKLDLPADLEKMLSDKVSTGQFASVDQVVVEALRLMDERDQMIEMSKADIRRKIADGVASLRQSGGVDGDSVFDRLMMKLDQLDERTSA